MVIDLNGKKVTDSRHFRLMVAQTPPKSKVTLKLLRDGKEKTLTLGTKEGGFSLAAVSDHPQAGKVEASLYDKLNVTPSDLYDRNLIRFDPNDLQYVIIRNQWRNLTAVNREGRWIVESPSEYKDKALGLTETLNALKAERADEVLPALSGPAAAKLSRPTLTAQFADKSGAVITLLAICGLTHREAYPDILVVAVLVPLVALAALIVLGTLFGAF